MGYLVWRRTLLHVFILHFSSSASPGEFGHSGGNGCAGQGCGVSAKDLSGTFPRRPRGAFCATYEAFGQRRLVHLPNVCVRAV